jgi:hypothetical protein
MHPLQRAQVARIVPQPAWALFAGTIGTVVWCLERIFPDAAHLVVNTIGASWITGRKKSFEYGLWLGVPWNVAGQFVLPVMYIYATEGVMPSPFDPDLFSRYWSVRSQEQRT